MKKSFQKTLIAASVGTLLFAGSMIAQAGTPGTTNLLFPYVTTATGSYTFISIAQQKGNAAVQVNPVTALTSTAPLHFTYQTKAISAANTDACSHIDGDAQSTKNDLMQFEIQNKVNLPAIFGDTTSVPKYFPAGPGNGDNQHGMLIVNNDNGGNYGQGSTYTDGILYGEARIINTASGLAAGYSTDDLHTLAGGRPDFADANRNGPDGAYPSKVVQWFADPTVTTTFLAVPLGDETAMAFTGGVRAVYQLSDASATQRNAGIAGQYNNNEGFQSSTTTAPVRCVGVFTRANLLGALNTSFSANGGWGNMVSVASAAGPTGLPVAVDPNVPSVVFKLESTSALGSPTSFVTRVPVL